MEALSTTEFAAKIGVSEAAVRNAIATKRIAVGPDGRIEPEQAAKDFANNRRAKPGPGRPRKKAASAEVPDEVEAGTLAEAHRLEVLVRTREREAKLAVYEGRYHEVALCDRVHFAKGRRIRDTLAQWVPAVSARLAGELGCDGRMLAAALDRELRLILRRLARDTVETLDPSAEGGEKDA